MPDFNILGGGRRQYEFKKTVHPKILPSLVLFIHLDLLWVAEVLFCFVCLLSDIMKLRGKQFVWRSKCQQKKKTFGKTQQLHPFSRNRDPITQHNPQTFVVRSFLKELFFFPYHYAEGSQLTELADVTAPGLFTSLSICESMHASFCAVVRK